MFEQSIRPESKFHKLKISLWCPVVVIAIGILAAMVGNNLLGHVLVVPLYPAFLIAMLAVQSDDLPASFFMIFLIAHLSFYGGGCYLILRFLGKRRKTRIPMSH
jgi:hypothetical protein